MGVFHSDTFASWIDELDGIARKTYGNGVSKENTSDNCWYAYFEAGYTPQEAFDEDQSYD